MCVCVCVCENVHANERQGDESLEKRWSDLDTGGDSCPLQPFTGQAFPTSLQHYTCLPYLCVREHIGSCCLHYSDH